MGLSYDYDRRIVAALPTKPSGPVPHRKLQPPREDQVEDVFRVALDDTLRDALAARDKIIDALTKAVPGGIFTGGGEKSPKDISVKANMYGASAVLSIFARSADSRGMKLMNIRITTKVEETSPEIYMLMPPEITFFGHNNTNASFSKDSIDSPAFTVQLSKLPTARDGLAMLDKITVERLAKLVGPFTPLPVAQKGNLTLKVVQDFIRKLSTYLELEEATPLRLYYVTRKHRSEGYSDSFYDSDAYRDDPWAAPSGRDIVDRPGKADIDEANRVAKAVREKFGDGDVKATVGAVDEWVSLTVELKG